MVTDRVAHVGGRDESRQLRLDRCGERKVHFRDPGGQHVGRKIVPLGAFSMMLHQSDVDLVEDGRSMAHRALGISEERALFGGIGLVDSFAFAVACVRAEARHDRCGRSRSLQQLWEVTIEHFEDLANRVVQLDERLYFVVFRGCEMPMRILVETIEAEPFGSVWTSSGRSDAKRASAVQAQGSQFDSECQVAPVAGPGFCHESERSGRRGVGSNRERYVPATRRPRSDWTYEAGGGGWGATPRCRLESKCPNCPRMARVRRSRPGWLRLGTGSRRAK